MSKSKIAEERLQMVLIYMHSDAVASDDKLKAIKNMWYDGEIDYIEVIKEAYAVREKLDAFKYLLIPLGFRINDNNDPATKAYIKFNDRERDIRLWVNELDHAARMLNRYEDSFNEVKAAIKAFKEGKVDHETVMMEFYHHLGTFDLEIEDVEALIRDIEHWKNPPDINNES